MNKISKRGSKRTISSKIAYKAARSKLDCTKNISTGLISPDNPATIDASNTIKIPQVKRLKRSFFNQPCIQLAKNLLGKVLTRRLDTGEILKGKIIETESYLGGEDKASQSYKGKKTERNEPMFMEPGTAYVYMTYGMYYLLNISSLGEGAAVLIRALEPLQGSFTMQTLRSLKRKKQSSLKDKELCNGPAKLCMSLQIEKQPLNKADLCTSEELWLEDGEDVSESDMVACKRIGIESAGQEWANKPLRFYVNDCPYVSVRNKAAEKQKHDLMEDT